MARSWITPLTVVMMAAIALVIASPLGPRVAHSWMPAIDLAIGTSLVLYSFIEIGRSLIAWVGHAAAPQWILGGLVLGAGLFTAGASSIATARVMAFDWVACAGIFTALAGVQIQSRARARSESSS